MKCASYNIICRGWVEWVFINKSLITEFWSSKTGKAEVIRHIFTVYEYQQIPLSHASSQSMLATFCHLERHYSHCMLRFSLYWDVMQRRLVGSYWSFRTNYQFHLQRSSSRRRAKISFMRWQNPESTMLMLLNSVGIQLLKFFRNYMGLWHCSGRLLLGCHCKGPDSQANACGICAWSGTGAHFPPSTFSFSPDRVITPCSILIDTSMTNSIQFQQLTVT